MDFKIKEIYLDNFKSFKDCKVKLDNFNIVIAPNNAGKSNLISALEFISYLFKYGLEKALDEFGGLETIKNYRSKSDEYISIEVKAFSKKVFYTFRKLTYDEEGNENLINEISFILEDLNINVGYKFLEEILELTLNIEGKYKVENKSKNFRKFYFKYKYRDNKEIIETNLPKKYKSYLFKIFLNENRSPDIPWLKYIHSYYFIPKEIKKISNYKSGDKLNKEGTNIASVLDNLRDKKPNIFENISNALIGIVNELEGIHIDKDTLGRSKLNFIESNNKLIPIDIVSDGTIHLIAMLTALYEPYPKSLISIEEPERHLHLKAISYLIEEFRDISVETQILITTQNTEILHNLDLKKDNLIFLFRDYEGNTKSITHRDIPRFKQKLKIYNNDIVELLRLEGLGYLGDYIEEKEV